MTEQSDGKTDARIQAAKVIAGFFRVCKSLRSEINARKSEVVFLFYIKVEMSSNKGITALLQQYS